MKHEDLKKVKDFYYNVIKVGLIKPLEMEEVYRLVAPDAPDTKYMLKQRTVTLFVEEKLKEVVNELEDLFIESDEKLEEMVTGNSPKADLEEDTTITNIPDDEVTVSPVKRGRKSNQTHKE